MATTAYLEDISRAVGGGGHNHGHVPSNPNSCRSNLHGTRNFYSLYDERTPLPPRSDFRSLPLQPPRYSLSNTNKNFTRHPIIDDSKIVVLDTTLSRSFDSNLFKDFARENTRIERSRDKNLYAATKV